MLYLKQLTTETEGSVRCCTFGKKGYVPCKSKDKIWLKCNSQAETDVIYPALESTEPTKLFSLKMKEEVIN